MKFTEARKVFFSGLPQHFIFWVLNLSLLVFYSLFILLSLCHICSLFPLFLSSSQPNWSFIELRLQQSILYLKFIIRLTESALLQLRHCYEKVLLFKLLIAWLINLIYVLWEGICLPVWWLASFRTQNKNSNWYSFIFLLFNYWHTCLVSVVECIFER